MDTSAHCVQSRIKICANYSARLYKAFIPLQTKLKTAPYRLYSAISLIKSSMEILLLSCLNKGENRESLSTFPWLSLNTGL